MNTTKLKEEINNTLTDLSATVKLFDQENLNKIPFEGSWTGGQVTQHLILSNSGFVDVLNGPATKTNRQFDQYVEGIRDSFLNFNIKMESPEFIVPEFREYQKVRQLQSLELIKTKINHSIDELDLEETCTAFEVPVLGYVTRWEALHFILYHTQRHIHQLKNIFAKLKESALIKKQTL